MQVRTARIWFDETECAYAVSTPFNRTFVDALKALVPPKDRSYDKPRTLWLVSAGNVDAVRKLVEQYFGSCEYHERVAPIIPAAAGGAVAEFVQLVGLEDMTRAYRAAAARLHPDRAGGDAAAMARLNELWTQVKEELR